MADFFSSLGGLKQTLETIKTPNISNLTLGNNASNVLNLFSGSAIGGISNAVGGLSNIAGQLSGSNPFTGFIGGLAQTGQASSGGGFLPNALSNVDQPAYHFKFMVVPDLTARNVMEGNLGALSNSLIISETGASEFNITDVELTGFFGLDRAVKNANVVKAEVKITEPLGASFLDRLYAASGACGIQNWMKACYFLQVKFHGYDPETGQYMDQIGGKTWTWACRISSLDVDVAAGGAKYVMQLISHDDFAMDSHFAFLASSFSPQISTVGQFFSELKRTLEQDQPAEYGYVRHHYNFVVHSVPPGYGTMPIYSNPESWAVQNLDFSLQPNRGTSTRGVLGETTIGTSVGETIKSLVTQVMSSTQEGQQLANRSSDPTRPSNQAENAVIWKIQSTTRITQQGIWYDVLNEDYNYDITYHIIPHIIHGGILSEEQRTDSNNQSLNQAKMSNLQNLGMLRKEYDYLFTGTNTEVIDFDIHTNLAWFAYTPNTMGAFNKSSSTPEKMNEDYQFLPQQFPDQLTKGNWLRSQITNFITHNGPTTINSIDAFVQASQELQGILTGALVGRGVANNLNGQYVETLDISGPKLLPQSFDRDTSKTDKEFAGDAEVDIRAGQAIYEMLIAQIFGTKAPLMSLDMTIRGDPYWLGNSTIEVPPSVGNNNSNFPDYYTGDNAVLVKFFFPKGIDENTGAPILEPVNLFTGLFVVNQVVSKFAGGKFTQHLIGYRNVNIVLDNKAGSISF